MIGFFWLAVTPEEKAKLVKYVGWGALSQTTFAGYRKEFPKERHAFRAPATDEEY